MNDCREAGFTLLELVVIITLIGILAVTVSSRFPREETFALQVAQQNVMSYLNLAQQLALSGQNNVRFEVRSATEVAVTVDGNLMIDGFTDPNPYDLTATSASIRIAPAALQLSYNSLGQVAPTTLTLSAAGSTTQVVIHGSGFAQAQ